MPECPHPEKIRHTTKGAAWAALRSLEKAGKGNPDMTPYRCVCGSWHVGHSLVSFRKRIRRALATTPTQRRRQKRRR